MQATDEKTGYKVEVRWSPAHELLTSLGTYLNYPEQKLLDLGPSWRRRVREGLPSGLRERLDGLGSGKGRRAAEDAAGASRAKATRIILHLLVWVSPPDLDAGQFLDWAARVPVTELLESVTKDIGERVDVPVNLAALRDEGVELLKGWHVGYFAGIGPEISDGLRRDAGEKAALALEMPAGELVERASCGVVLEATPGIHTVVLIPQYHSRPWNIFSDFGGKLLLNYPAEAWAPKGGQPSTRLVRVTRALADESRLRILAFLGGGIRTFGAIAECLGLAKSTVHHHMVVLRAAGLVRVFTRYGQYLGDRYALRREALQEIGPLVERFISAEGLS